MTVSATRAPFGRTPDGEQVEAITLTNARGLSATVISYGAALQAMVVPDREGRMADVTLGYPGLDGYLTGTEYFGATVGRVANRIAQGRFTLDGKVYRVPANNGPNSLHGGAKGFDKVVWEMIEVGPDGAAAVTLRYVSPAGDQGYPGTLTVTATYRLGGDDRLRIEYRATTDALTIVNLSHHAYWNLAGEGSEEGAMGHMLTIPADHYCPTDPTSIPTGELRPVEGSPFDFRRPTAIGARVRDANDSQIVIGRGYDHNWAIGREATESPSLLARLEEPRSGRVLEVASNQPGLQFYSGNFMDGTRAGKAGRLYRQGDGIALEPQMFPDTPNQPEFGSIRLNPDQTYRHLIEFGFGVSHEP